MIVALLILESDAGRGFLDGLSADQTVGGKTAAGASARAFERCPIQPECGATPTCNVTHNFIQWAAFVACQHATV